MQRVKGTFHGRGAVSGLIIFFLIIILCPMPGDAQRRDARRNAQQKTVRQEVKVPAAPVARTGEDEAAEKKQSEVPKEAPAAKQARGEEAFLPYESYNRPSEEPESYGWLIFKTIFIIGLLLGGFYYFFRFVTRKAGLQVLGHDVIQVLAVAPLGPNKFLQVVDLAGRIIVIGVTDSNINIITEINEKDEIDRIRLLSSRSMPVATGGFQDFITKQVGKIFGRDESPAEETPVYRESADSESRLGYLQRQKDRLRRMNGDE
ncbi:MAG TPA: flagellar biosynthetic protein FliO [Spirochaetota bacterium]|nr:flagellar biosynthetic protein FliO [Spirochaetota bacterium]